MKKKLIKTTFFLLFYSSIAKVLSFVVRITLARNLSSEAMNYYALTMPTMLLLITLAQFGIPNAMAKLLASTNNAKKTIKASILLSITNNLLILFALTLFIPIITHTIFKDPNLLAVFYSCLPMIPLITLSGLLKGYLMGRHQLIAYSMAQVSEELFRLLFLIFALPLCTNAVILAKIAVLSMAIGEIASSIHMLIAIGFKRKPNLLFLKEKANKTIYFSLISMALPMTLSRLVGSITFFLEPMFMLVNVEASLQNIMFDNFTLINSYVFPLIVLPSFASVMVSNWALPIFSEAFSKKNFKQLKTTFTYTCSFALFIGILWSFLLFIFPDEICMILYKQAGMSSILRKLAFPFCVFSIQPILTSFLHATNKSNQALKGTIVGCVVRLGCILILPIYTLDNSLILSLCISMLLTTFLHFSHSIKTLFFNHI